MKSQLFYLYLLISVDIGFSTLSSDNIDESTFYFTELDLTNSFVDVRLIQKLLSTSKTLKCLDLSYCTKMTDAAFKVNKFTCPLEFLSLNYLNLLTGETLKSIQNIPTLKSLLLKGCTRFKNQGYFLLDISYLSS